MAIGLFSSDPILKKNIKILPSVAVLFDLLKCGLFINRLTLLDKNFKSGTNRLFNKLNYLC